MLRKSTAFFTLFLAVLSASGCSSKQVADSADRENSHLRWLLRLRLHGVQQGRALHSEQDFKQFLTGIDSSMRDRVLAGAGIGGFDELFVSERDGLPYVFFYTPPKKGEDKTVVGYEQQGVGGRRFVGFASGVVEEIDEARFDTLIPVAARPVK